MNFSILRKRRYAGNNFKKRTQRLPHFPLPEQNFLS